METISREGDEELASRDEEIQQIIDECRKQLEPVNKQLRELNTAGAGRQATIENTRLCNERTVIRAKAFDHIAALFD